jgi:predicted esterase
MRNTECGLRWAKKHRYPPQPSSSTMTSSQSNDEQKESINLEIQKGTDFTGEPVWQDAGPIELLDGNPFSSRASSSDATAASTRPQLPQAAKDWFGVLRSKPHRRSLYSYRHAPRNAHNTNLLVLLHGAGDSHGPYDKLAQTMALPQTAALSLSASCPGFTELPFQLGYTWFQEMDYTTGSPLSRDHAMRQSSLLSATQRLCDFIQGLTQQWIPERIFLLGYGSGATVAMTTCQYWCQNCKKPALGGAVCVGGGDCLSSIPITINKTCGSNERASQASPILLVVGGNDAGFPPSVAKTIQSKYMHDCGSGNEQLVQIHVQPNKAQSMISSEEESKAVMEFLAPKLVRVQSMPTRGA